ncbi:hypothetical protein ACVOMT_11015 [Sphingomonas panni]|uniref:hypothetical protein n=1 Tax=Sphingomonas panni TaxID=237612 RepID=UPI001F5B4C3B|nr:hypothetical protein [Sphingomonas panni]
MRGWLKSRMPRVDRAVLARIMTLWVLVVLLYFLWEMLHYSGLYATLAEWQFDQFGQFAPTLTFVLPVLLFASPALLLLRDRHQRDDPRYADQSPVVAAHISAVRFRQFLFVVASALLSAAVVIALVALTRTADRRADRIVTADPAGVTAADSGAAKLRGTILYDRTAAFAQNLLVTRRGVRFAPIVAAGTYPAMPQIAYFVELEPRDQARMTPNERVEDRTGTLVRNNLPGSIERLYRYAGLRVTRPYYVLYNSTRTMRAPYWVVAAQLTLAGLVMLIAGLLQTVHLRRTYGPATPKAGRAVGAGS